MLCTVIAKIYQVLVAIAARPACAVKEAATLLEETKMRILGNAVVFVLCYVIFMLPTYYLPYVGSNSVALNTLGIAADAGMNPAFWLHLGALIVLILVTWFRGSYIDKQWLVIFPIIATVFDLVPVLSSIPLIPTVMHLLAVILGPVGASAVVPAPQQGS